jgi:hypothetical protein
MAEDAAGRIKRKPSSDRRWDAERIATVLVTQRNRLVEQPPASSRPPGA